MENTGDYCPPTFSLVLLLLLLSLSPSVFPSQMQYFSDGALNIVMGSELFTLFFSYGLIWRGNFSCLFTLKGRFIALTSLMPGTPLAYYQCVENQQ